MGRVPWKATWVALVLAVVLAAPAEGAFPGRDGLIAFERYWEDTGVSALYVIRPDGSRLRRVPSTFRSKQWAWGMPAWSPDGRALAYVRWRTSLDARSQIMIARPWTAKPRFFAYGSHPAWSPDGRSIAFTTYREDVPYEPYETYYINVKPTRGGEKRELTAWQEVALQNLAWSPDGARIAFDEDRPNATGYDRDIYAIAVADGTEGPLVEGVDEYANGEWHPKGFPLAFECEWNTYWHEICLYDPATPGDDGDGIHYLMHENGEGAVDGWDFDPVWSPSGRWIAWQRTARNPSSYDIYTMRADGTSWRRITRGKAWDVDPVWGARPR